jgi:hydrogenase maturation protease
MNARTLVAGIGNVFLGDDGFGVAVVNRLAGRPSRPGVRVVDFGIRSVDLAFALLDAYDQVILIDALPRGGPPGTLYVLEPDALAAAEPIEGHSLNLAQALGWVRAMGGTRAAIRIVGCDPAVIPADGDVAVGLSPPVLAAVDRAAALVDDLLDAVHA